jgi:DNA-binding CsgD family transcriptional regulator
LFQTELKRGGDAVGVVESFKTGASAVPAFYGKKLGLRKDEKSALTNRLTQRERDTYRLLLEGYTLRETADQLGIGYSTVNTYQTAVYRKLHVNSRAELIINYHDIEG